MVHAINGSAKYALVRLCICISIDHFLVVLLDSSVVAYLPIVQSSLPRILNAAAPPGGVARENRKQCLKVRGVYNVTLSPVIYSVGVACIVRSFRAVFCLSLDH